MRSSITMTIESAEADREHVSLDAFSLQLDALTKVLSNTESSLSGEQAGIDWQVADLKHSSPAQIVLQPIDTRIDTEEEDIIPKTVNKVIGYFKRFSEKAPPPIEMNQRLLRHYKTFSERVQKSILRVSLKSETDSVKVDENVKAAIEAATLSETKAIGTVEGRLEYLNIHNRNVFRIYSPMPPEIVNCVFSLDKIEEARKALGCKIRVLGELTYPKGNDFPKDVKVQTIEVLLEDDDLPSLTSLRGIAPDITGDLSSEEFVRNLRDAD